MVRWLLGVLVVSSATAAAAQDVVQVQGSSTVFPLADAVAQELEAASGRRLRVDVAVSGTGGGFEALCGKRADVATASRPILADEAEACRRAGVRFVELPLALDALSIVVHPGNTFVASLDMAQLRRAWGAERAGAPLRWSDLDPSWPDRPVNLYAPDPKSGTCDYFNDALFGRRDGARTDVSASDSDFALTQRVARDPDALGYFGAAYVAAAGGRVRAVPIAPEPGAAAIEPTEAAVRDGRYQPFTRPLLVYASLRSLRREAVADYVALLVARAPQVAAEFGYVALSPEGYLAVARRLERRTTGTVFDDQRPGGYRLDTIVELERGR